jgi:outer membrane immunogenic protein
MTLMKKILACAALAASFVSAPVMAESEPRLELRGGMAFGGGSEKAFLGAALGYDFDLGETMFAGIDLGADKVLTGGSKVLWSAGGRIGAKVSEKGKLYAVGGIGFCCGFSDPYAGVGYQHSVAEKVYLKAEVRHVFAGGSDGTFAGVGVGVNF